MDNFFRLKNLATDDIVTLTQSSISVGRGPYNYLQLGSDLLSAQHASIALRKEKAFIEDLDSTNGTRVNGMPISSETELMHGDVIGLGGEEFMLIAPGKEDDATVFSLNVGRGVVTPSSKLAELATGTLDEKESKELTDKLLKYVLSKRKKPFQQRAAVMVTLPKSTLGSMHEFECTVSAGNRWFIGRDESCNASIDHPTVSVKHATLTFEDGDWTITDNGSTNGTKVNGKRVVERVCKNGDVITLGKLTCVFGVVEEVREPVDEC